VWWYGYINSKKMNTTLMMKWIWKLFQGDNSTWAQIISAKYVEARDIFSGMSQGGSPFWKSLYKIKHFFKLGARHQILDGVRTQFWFDICMDLDRSEIASRTSLASVTTRLSRWQWLAIQIWVSVSVELSVNLRRTSGGNCE
jgi:hypothetical protein